MCIYRAQDTQHTAHTTQTEQKKEKEGYGWMDLEETNETNETNECCCVVRRSDMGRPEADKKMGSVSVTAGTTLSTLR